MKKTYFMAALAAFSMAATAQTVCTMDFDALGISGSTDIAADMLLCEDENGALYAAFGDNAKPQSIKAGGYENYTVNGGEELGMGSGLGGSNNPTFSYYEEGAPTAGWVFKYVAKADGYVTVLTKLSPNKQYLVMEGKTGALPYTLGFALNGEGYAYNQPEIKDEADENFGLIDFNDNPDNKYFIAGQIQSKNDAGELLWKDKDGNIVAGERPVWEEDGKEKKGGAVMEDVPGTHKPQFPYVTVGLASNPGNAAGIIQFNVLKDNSYYICALGSKIIIPGFIYTADAKPAITFTGAEVTPVTLSDKGAFAGVEGITVDSATLEVNAPIYNLMGVRVNADAKGILIQNGKKIIRK